MGMNHDAAVAAEIASNDTVWNDDSIQFPRLLAEVYAIVMFTDDQLDELSESMDLPRERLYELFERAETKWEAIKAERDEPRRDKCPVCRGTGTLEVDACVHGHGKAKRVKCGGCGGTGGR